MSGSSYFPEEIIEEILLNLPIESLIRFTAVCKSWNFLIKSPSFIHTQSNKQNPAHLLLLCQNHWLTRFSLYWDNPNSFDVCRVLTGPSAINTTAVSYKVEGTCNGVVCLADYMHNVAVIWNPSVRKYVILPSPTRTPLTYAKYAFGYDSQTNDYKVLRILVGCGFVGQKPIPVEADVWSLARGSWMSLNAALIPPGCELHNRSSSINGALHWASLSHCIILTFDISTESFGEMMMPEVLTRDVQGHFFISKYQESLALVYKLSNQNVLHIWVMKEYGVADSWTRLSTVPWNFYWITHLCFRKSGELVIQTTDVGNLQSVDPKSKETKQMPDISMVVYIDPFVESLALLGEPNAWSY